MKEIESFKYYLLIIFVGLILFVPLLGNVHLFDWDEINFAEAAREMIETKDYLTVRIDYEPFHEKPPLFIWLQVVSMKTFGVNEFAARFPNAIIGVITRLLIFNIGIKIFNQKFGMLWVLAYIGSFLPHFYFRSGIIDPLFNLFIFLSLYFIAKYYFIPVGYIIERKVKYIFFSGICVSLAVLTKGPVGWLIPFLTWIVYWFINRKTEKFPIRELVLFSLISPVLFTVWYAIMMTSSGHGTFQDFVNYQFRLMTKEDAGHGGPFYYHFVVLLIGCFPSSVIMLRAILRNPSDNPNQRILKDIMLILCVVVLIVFSIVQTKIIHYSSIAYFPITFLAAYSMFGILYGNVKWKVSTSWLIAVLGLLFGILLTCFIWILINIKTFLPLIKDKFTYGLLSADVNWLGIEYFIGIIYIAGVLISLYFFSKNELLKGFLTIFTNGAILLILFLPIIAPKIEKYTQSTPIEFYLKLKGQDCYVHSLGFKSYSPYFYTLKPYSQSAASKGIPHNEYESWLLNGTIDKPAYCVCKNKDLDKYLKNKNLKFLFSKNGYVFLKKNNFNSF